MLSEGTNFEQQNWQFEALFTGRPVQVLQIFGLSGSMEGCREEAAS